MADTKISALPAVTTPASTDEFAVNQGGTTKKETRAQIHALESGETLDARSGTFHATAVNVAGVVMLDHSGDYAQYYDQSGAVAWFAGGTGDEINYFNNTGHRFRSRDGSADYFIVDAAGARFLSTAPINTNDLTNSGIFILITVTTLADDATPSVSASNLFKTGGATTITDFDDGVVGQTIMVLSAHTITITDGAPIILAGGANFDMVATDTLTLTMFNDQVWNEVSRSVN